MATAKHGRRANAPAKYLFSKAFAIRPMLQFGDNMAAGGKNFDSTANCGANVGGFDGRAKRRDAPEEIQADRRMRPS